LNEEEEEWKREDRRAWLGDSTGHGGGYRTPERPGCVPEVGCCLIEAAGSVAVLAGLAAFSLHLFVR
jgi:hypothetical protein